MIESNNQEDKRKLLIEAAIKRFSHFGISKTTLSEIAEDAHISKANLYYYFPDKWALVEAIVDVLIRESDKKYKAFLKKSPSVEEALLQMLESKMEYFEKYRMLIRNLNEVNVHEPRFRTLSDRLFEVERQMVARVLEHGINVGEIETIDVEALSNLYTTSMRGLAMYRIYSDPSPLVDMESVRLVQAQQRLLNKIICRGITRK